ncbi:MAG: O-antigen ligase family protein [Coriobacteriia bacterium]|nr:O-antigen ligase family protein [Coriobacteriia bacterium]
MDDSARGSGRLHLRSLRVTAPALLALIGLKDAVFVVSWPPVRLNPFWTVFVLGVLATVAELAFRRALRQGWPRLGVPAEVWVLALMPLAGLISTSVSVDPAKSALYAGRLAALWLVAVLVSAACQDPATARRCVQSFVVGGLLMVLVGALQMWRPELGIGSVNSQRILLEDPSIYVRPAGFYLDANFFATHLVAAAIAAIGLFMASRERLRGGWLVAAGLQLGMVVVTYSRSALVVLVVGLVLLLVKMSRRDRIRVAAVVVLSLMLGAAAANPATVTRRVVTIAEPERPGSNRTRLLMIESAARMAVEHAPLGVGLEGFDDVYPAYQDPGAQREIAHPHEVPVSFVAETGLPGLLALIAAVISVGRATVQWLRGGLEPWLGVLPAAVAVMSGSVFQYFLYYEVLWLLLAVAMARYGSTAAIASEGSGSDASRCP